MPQILSIYAAWTNVHVNLAPLGAPFAPLLVHEEEEECLAADVILRAPRRASLTIRIVYDATQARWKIPPGQLRSRLGIYGEGPLGDDDFLQLLVPAGTTFSIRLMLAAA
jgi:hypothetical protein